MGSFGFEEMLVVVVVAIILFGKELPSIARKVGKWYFNLRKQLTDIKDELKSQIPDTDDLDVTKDLREIREDLKKDLEAAGQVDPPSTEPVYKPHVHDAPQEGNGHDAAPSPSANLPGPDPGDPEYKPDVHARFEPSKPPGAEPPKSETPAETKES